jgi:putative spermidine/putrescine transport system substrate-binding protein
MVYKNDMVMNSLKHGSVARASPLRILVTTPSAHPPIVQRAEADLGLTIEMSALDSREIVRRTIDEPSSFDLVQLEYWMVKEVWPAGVLQGIPVRKLARFDDLLPLFTDGTVDGRPVARVGTPPHSVQFVHGERGGMLGPDGSDFLSLAPTICNSDTLGWLADRVPRDVTSWGDLLDPAFRGMVALADIPSVAIVEAALACSARALVAYEDLGDMSRVEIDATLAVLVEARRNGQFHGLWRRYEESVTFMTDGPVALQSLWPPAASALAARGTPLRYRPLREGARGWAGGFALAAHLGGSRREEALAYIDWYQSGWAGAYLSRQGYYSAVPSAARAFLSDDEWGFWYEGARALEGVADPAGRLMHRPGAVREGGAYAERMGQVSCWSSRMREDPYLQQQWQVLLGA